MADKNINYGQLKAQIQNELQRNDSDIVAIIEHAITDAIRHFKDECFAINQASFYLTAPAYNNTLASDGSGDTASSANPLRFAMLTLPTDFSSMINVQLNKDGTLYEMTQVSYPEIDAMDALAVESDGTTITKHPHTGTPQYYAYLGEASSVTSSAANYTNSSSSTIASTVTPGKIRIFPRPDKDYTVTLRYVSNLQDPRDVSSETLSGAPDSVKGFWMNEAQRMIKTYAKGLIYADYLQQYEQAQAQEVMAQAEYNRLVARSENRAFQSAVTGYI